MSCRAFVNQLCFTSSAAEYELVMNLFPHPIFLSILKLEKPNVKCFEGLCFTFPANCLRHSPLPIQEGTVGTCGLNYMMQKHCGTENQ